MSVFVCGCLSVCQSVSSFVRSKFGLILRAGQSHKDTTIIWSIGNERDLKHQRTPIGSSFTLRTKDLIV